MAITANTMIGTIVKQNFKTAPLFHSNNIDYCCGGNKTLSEACEKAGVDVEQLIGQLEMIITNSDPETEFVNSLPLDELCDFIVKRHHSYVKSQIPFLKANLEKLCNVHGNNHPELFEIKKLFDGSAGELSMHMQKEEIVLFPFIQKMVRAKHDGTSPGVSVFGPVANPIGMMLNEHDAEGRRFEKIAELAENYAIPDDACTTYQTTMRQLSDFEKDLHRHIHLENNILFPGAIELEAELNENAGHVSLQNQ
jgi:regulator of cell morphogenesis and NO signaling